MIVARGCSDRSDCYAYREMLGANARALRGEGVCYVTRPQACDSSGGLGTMPSRAGARNSVSLCVGAVRTRKTICVCPQQSDLLLMCAIQWSTYRINIHRHSCSGCNPPTQERTNPRNVRVCLCECRLHVEYITHACACVCCPYKHKLADKSDGSIGVSCATVCMCACLCVSRF